MAVNGSKEVLYSQDWFSSSRFTQSSTPNPGDLSISIRTDNGNANLNSNPADDRRPGCIPSKARNQDSCVPLYNAAQSGDWKTAKEEIDADKTIVQASIAQGSYTVLHVAAGACRVQFVTKLMKMISEDSTCSLTHVLRLQDKRCNTAFCLAVAAGSVKIAKIMIRKDSSLPEQLGFEGKTPLYYAALFGHKKMALYLYSQPSLVSKEDLRGLFFTCINTGLYGLASIILKKNPEFATDRDHESKTALHLLAQKPLAFERDHSGTPPGISRASKILKHCAELARDEHDSDEYFKTVLHLLAKKPFESGAGSLWNRFQQYRALKDLEKYPELVLELDGDNLREALRKEQATSTSESRRALQERLKRHGNPVHALFKDLWDKVGEKSHKPDDFISLLKNPTHLLFDAVKSGNSKFVAQVIHDCPDLIWETDENNRTIIHAAVLHRHPSIYSLIHTKGIVRDVIVTYKDQENNSILHLAAQSAPAGQLNKLAGAAFRMQRELLWFEEVKRIMKPTDIEMRNSKGQTPQEIFTDTHENLLKDAEKWMNETARSCTIVSTLIAGALFAAGITVSFGENKDQGDQHLNKAAFHVFIISDAIAFFSSLIATLIFFSILTSRYAERDFLRSLPFNLLAGLTLLLFSIIAMVVAFSTAFFIPHGLKKIPIVVAVCAGFPVLSFVGLQFPLWRDTFGSTLCSKFLFKPSQPLF